MVTKADFFSFTSCRSLIKNFNFNRHSSKINGQINSFYQWKVIHNHFLFVFIVIVEDEIWLSPSCCLLVFLTLWVRYINFHIGNTIQNNRNKQTNKIYFQSLGGGGILVTIKNLHLWKDKITFHVILQFGVSSRDLLNFFHIFHTPSKNSKIFSLCCATNLNLSSLINFPLYLFSALSVAYHAY